MHKNAWRPRAYFERFSLFYMDILQILLSFVALFCLCLFVCMGGLIVGPGINSLFSGRKGFSLLCVKTAAGLWTACTACFLNALLAVGALFVSLGLEISPRLELCASICFACLIIWIAAAKFAGLNAHASVSRASLIIIAFASILFSASAGYLFGEIFLSLMAPTSALGASQFSACALSPLPAAAALLCCLFFMVEGALFFAFLPGEPEYCAKYCARCISFMLAGIVIYFLAFASAVPRLGNIKLMLIAGIAISYIAGRAAHIQMRRGRMRTGALAIFALSAAMAVVHAEMLYFALSTKLADIPEPNGFLKISPALALSIVCLTTLITIAHCVLTLKKAHKGKIWQHGFEGNDNQTVGQ